MTIGTKSTNSINPLGIRTNNLIAHSGQILNISSSNANFGILQITNPTQSTSTSTGALVVTGGVGVEKDINIGGNLFLSGNIGVEYTSQTLYKYLSYSGQLGLYSISDGITKIAGTTFYPTTIFTNTNLNVNIPIYPITSSGTIAYYLCGVIGNPPTSIDTSNIIAQGNISLSTTDTSINFSIQNVSLTANTYYAIGLLQSINGGCYIKQQQYGGVTGQYTFYYSTYLSNEFGLNATVTTNTNNYVEINNELFMNNNNIFDVGSITVNNSSTIANFILQEVSGFPCSIYADSSQNTGFGQAVLRYGSDYSNCSAFGHFALNSTTYSSDNTAMGTNASRALEYGSYNTIIGSGGFGNAIGGNCNTTLGYATIVNFNGTCNNNTLIGANITFNGNNPYTQSSGLGYGVIINDDNQIVLGTATEYVSIPGTTQSTSTSTGALVVLGGVGIGNQLFVSGNVTAPNYLNPSDYRIKTNIKSLDQTYNVDKLNPITYLNIKNNNTEIGLIAHELQKEYPFLVNGEKDGENLQSVNYIGLIGILINEIKDLKKRIEQLENK